MVAKKDKGEGFENQECDNNGKTSQGCGASKKKILLLKNSVVKGKTDLGRFQFSSNGLTHF